MNSIPVSRRQALKTTALAVAAASVGTFDLTAAGVHWPVGCFNRPWMQKGDQPAQPLTDPQPANWGFDAALRGMKQAGFRMIGLLTRTADEPFISAKSSDDYISGLKQRIKESGLVANMGSITNVNARGSLADGIKRFCASLQIDQ